MNVNLFNNNSELEKKNKIRINNNYKIQCLREQFSKNHQHESLSIFKKYNQKFLLKFIKILNECGYLPKISRTVASRKELTLGYININFNEFMKFWDQLDWEVMK